MRTFVLYSRGSTGAFNLNDLPSSGHRMDLVARCVNSALFVSYALRQDTRIYIVLNGPPEPPKTVVFEGSSLLSVAPDERNIASWILKANVIPVRGKEWVSVQKGMRVSAQSFQDIVKELKGPFYVLHERGRDIRQEEIKGNPIFLLGDSVDIPKNDEKIVQRYKPTKLSLGKVSYLASHCIAIVHNELDRRGL